MRHELIQHRGCGTDGHALENDTARTLHGGVEKAFAAEQHVLKSFDGTDFHGAALAHGRQIACIDDLAGSRRDVVVMRGTVDFQKDQSCAAEFPHQEAFAAEESCAETLL